jgi:hypothetical protein
MQMVMAIGIEPEAMTERRFLGELCLWHDLEVVDQSAVHLIQCAKDLNEHQTALLFDHLGIKGIDAALQGVAWWLSSAHDHRQIRQSLSLPDGYMCQDILYRPGSHGARGRHLCIGQARIRLPERCPPVLKTLQKLLPIHTLVVALSSMSIFRYPVMPANVPELSARLGDVQ